MQNQPADVLRALDDLERALDAFRLAYTAWLNGDGNAADLSRTLTAAEERLDAARAALAGADEADKRTTP